MTRVAEQTINDLTPATDIYNDDLFLLQQNGQAKSLAASKLTNYINRDVENIKVDVVDFDVVPVSTYDEESHTLNMQVNRGPGIEDVEKTATVGKVDTYTITTQDNQQFNFEVTNGDGLVNSVMGVSPSTGTFDVPLAGIMNLIYPVGSIYMSMSSTSPATLFGMGTWVAIEGSFLVGVKSDDTDFSTAGNTGGEKTHTLTSGEMPAHNHGSNGAATTGSIGLSDGNTTSMTDANGYNLLWSKASTSGTYIAVKQEGSGQAHNNLPPYFAVYMWQRTA